MSAAIAVSGGGNNDFSTNGGFPNSTLVQDKIAGSQMALLDLLKAAKKKAPVLIAEPASCLPLVRLAVWVPREQWVRPLDEWEVDGGSKKSAKAAFASLRAHLLEQWPVASVLHGALELTGDGRSAQVPESVHRQAFAFTSVLVAAGSGSASVKDSLEAAITPPPRYLLS